MTQFAYHRSLAPMMWVFVVLASIEMLVVHLVVVMIDWRVALVLSLLSLSTVIWIVMLIRSFRRYPVELDDARVLMRAGKLKSVEIARANIAGVRRHFTGDEIKQPGVAKLSLIAYPNVLIALREPVIGARGRKVTAVAHKLDDPDAFFAALGEMG